MSSDGFIWDEIEEVTTEDNLNVSNNEQPPTKKIKKKRKKWKKRLLVFLIFAIAVSFLFVPIFQVDEIVISQTYFVTKEEIEDSIGITIGNSYSFWEIRNDAISDDISELVSDINVKYNNSTNTLTIDVKEIKPIALDENGTFYYSTDEEIATSNNIYYSVPKLIGFEEEMKADLIEALNTLDYKIIKEIVGIEYVEDDVLPDLVMMQMMDGNIVYITISEIENKMPYYLQMSQVIEQEATKKPGIIHLERGNYYEPI